MTIEETIKKWYIYQGFSIKKNKEIVKLWQQCLREDWQLSKMIGEFLKIGIVIKINFDNYRETEIENKEIL
jgi:hypothetical protein